MPKKIDKKAIRESIMSQGDKCFTPDDIAFQTQVSPASAYLMIKELSSCGIVKVDHKDGRRLYYSLNEDEVQQKNDILSIPPKERFEYISHLTDMVINGYSPSLLITGISGIGKTFLVKDRFKEMGKRDGHDYHFVSGHSSPMGLYRFLHDHRDQVCVFDDCDSVFGDAIAINILKSALDSYDVRKVSWQSARMPEDLEPEFRFEGSVIFISNLDESRIDEAVKSRTYVIDLQMSRKEVFDYMVSISDKLCPEVAVTDKKEVLEYLDDVKEHFKQFNLRTFIKVARMKASVGANVDWRKMALILD
jgi:hypothetical protein